MDSLDREEVRKALELLVAPDMPPLSANQRVEAAKVLEAFVDGRLIDRQTLDYEAATALFKELAGIYDEGIPTHRLLVKAFVDSAVGEGEQ